jgi:predicted CoA-binding protein
MSASEIGARSKIDAFLAQRRFAMIGASRNEKDFSRTLLREFLDRGYDVVPVHPHCGEMEGRSCAPSIAEIVPPVDSVLLMTPPSVSEALVLECEKVGVKRVWMYRAAGAGSVSPRAVAFCRANRMEVIPGECPLMFLPDTNWFHRLHGFVRRIKGTYPD